MPTRLLTGFLVSTTLLLTGCNLSVSVVGNGAGSVTSQPQGISCSNRDADCLVKFSAQDEVTLTAQSAPGSLFVGWEGACEGQQATCSLSMNAERRVTARFRTTQAQDLACGTDAAKAGCLAPTFSDEYYIEQSIKYFRTMESSVPINVIPNYSDLVARWEWPPWLMLTGYTRANLIWTDIALKLNPTAYAKIDCRAFPVQPFGRCYVIFNYEGELCPIYEEFTFNDQGEMTFIEAWTDAPGWIPMDPDDTWAERDNVNRLATRIPGLGNATGRIDLDAEWMQEAASQDADVADFVRRARKPYGAWFGELAANSAALSKGCHPVGTNPGLGPYAP